MGDELRGENLVHLNVRFSTETELKKIQDFLYEKSGQGVSFTGLVEAMANEVTIVTAVHNIKSNKGSRTAGVDKIKMDKYLQMPKDELILLIQYAKGRMNFEYYMNREYAYSRDKGKCKCCGNAFSPVLQKHCHHVKNKLPLDRINKVPNLVWLCEPCHRMVHNSPIPPELDAKTVGKIMKYREKLKL